MRSRSVAGMVGACFALVACGGRLAAVDEGDAGSHVGAPQLDAGERDGASVDGGPDAPADSPFACIPTASDITGCPADAGYCVVLLGADAAIPHGDAFPDAGTISSECEDAPLNMACDGGQPVALGYAIYGNRVAWVACPGP